MVNRVVLVGRLTRDPELRNLDGGRAVLNFSIAMNRQFSKEEKTDFIDCTAWNKTAEIMAQYLNKGALISVDGRLQQDTYNAQDGSKRSKVVVMCDTVQFLESKSRSEERVKTTSATAKVESLDKNLEESTTVPITDEDLPW